VIPHFKGISKAVCVQKIIKIEIYCHVFCHEEKSRVSVMQMQVVPSGGNLSRCIYSIRAKFVVMINKYVGSLGTIYFGVLKSF